MRLLKNFKEFLDIGIVKKKARDLLRAKSLVKESERRKKFLDKMSSKIGLSDEDANYFIETSYDILIELIRANLFMDGFRAVGEGSHKAEISYMKNIGFLEKDIKFMNDLRYFRNGILYYGKNFNKEYALKVLKFLNKIYPKLMKVLKK